MVHQDNLENPARLENLALPDSPEKLETKDLQEMQEVQAPLVSKVLMQNRRQVSQDLQGNLFLKILWVKYFGRQLINYVN